MRSKKGAPDAKMNVTPRSPSRLIAPKMHQNPRKTEMIVRDELRELDADCFVHLWNDPM